MYRELSKHTREFRKKFTHMSNIVERIGQIIVSKNISIRSFEQSIGASNGMIGRAVNKGSDIAASWLSKIIETHPNINADWLLSGRGAMFNNENLQLAPPKIEEQFALRTDRKIELQRVPLYELDAVAGLVALFDTNTRQVPISHLQIPDLPPCDGALYVRGDSMYPLLKSGDIILYKEVANSISNIFWGEMYLLSFILDGETYISIKYIQKADDAQFVRLVSYNTHHTPKDIPVDAIRALALVKASVRFNTMG
jgi:phage repressor protein C with HTH and peptisase S24 domain